MYGKLVNGSLFTSPKNVEYDNKIIINPKEDILLALGYFPVIYTDIPSNASDGYHYESHWEQRENEIVQVWNLVEDVEKETSIEERVYELEEALEMLLSGVTE